MLMADGGGGGGGIGGIANIISRISHIVQQAARNAQQAQASSSAGHPAYRPAVYNTSGNTTAQFTNTSLTTQAKTQAQQAAEDELKAALEQARQAEQEKADALKKKNEAHAAAEQAPNDPVKKLAAVDADSNYEIACRKAQLAKDKARLAADKKEQADAHAAGDKEKTEKGQVSEDTQHRIDIADKQVTADEAAVTADEKALTAAQHDKVAKHDQAVMDWRRANGGKALPGFEFNQNVGQIESAPMATAEMLLKNANTVRDQSVKDAKAAEKTAADAANAADKARADERLRKAQQGGKAQEIAAAQAWVATVEAQNKLRTARANAAWGKEDQDPAVVAAKKDFKAQAHAYADAEMTAATDSGDKQRVADAKLRKEILGAEDELDNAEKELAGIDHQIDEGGATPTLTERRRRAQDAVDRAKAKLVALVDASRGTAASDVVGDHVLAPEIESPARGGATFKVGRGDSLWSIATWILSDPLRLQNLCSADPVLKKKLDDDAASGGHATRAQKTQWVVESLERLNPQFNPKLQDGKLHTSRPAGTTGRDPDLIFDGETLRIGSEPVDPALNHDTSPYTKLSDKELDGQIATAEADVAKAPGKNDPESAWRDYWVKVCTLNSLKAEWQSRHSAADNSGRGLVAGVDPVNPKGGTVALSASDWKDRADWLRLSGEALDAKKLVDDKYNQDDRSAQAEQARAKARSAMARFAQLTSEINATLAPSEGSTTIQAMDPMSGKPIGLSAQQWRDRADAFGLEATASDLEAADPPDPKTRESKNPATRAARAAANAALAKQGQINCDFHAKDKLDADGKVAGIDPLTGEEVRWTPQQWRDRSAVAAGYVKEENAKFAYFDAKANGGDPAHTDELLRTWNREWLVFEKDRRTAQIKLQTQMVDEMRSRELALQARRPDKGEALSDKEQAELAALPGDAQNLQDANARLQAQIATIERGLKRLDLGGGGMDPTVSGGDHGLATISDPFAGPRSSNGYGSAQPTTAPRPNSSAADNTPIPDAAGMTACDPTYNLDPTDSRLKTSDGKTYTGEVMYQGHKYQVTVVDNGDQIEVRYMRGNFEVRTHKSVRSTQLWKAGRDMQDMPVEEMKVALYQGLDVYEKEGGIVPHMHAMIDAKRAGQVEGNYTQLKGQMDGLQQQLDKAKATNDKAEIARLEGLIKDLQPKFETAADTREALHAWQKVNQLIVAHAAQSEIDKARLAAMQWESKAEGHGTTDQKKKHVALQRADDLGLALAELMYPKDAQARLKATAQITVDAFYRDFGTDAVEIHNDQQLRNTIAYALFGPPKGQDSKQRDWDALTPEELRMNLQTENALYDKLEKDQKEQVDTIADTVRDNSVPGNTIYMHVLRGLMVDKKGDLSNLTLFSVSDPWSQTQVIDMDGQAYDSIEDYRNNNETMPRDSAFSVLPEARTVSASQLYQNPTAYYHQGLEAYAQTGPDGHIELSFGDARHLSGWESFKAKYHVDEVVMVAAVVVSVVAFIPTGGASTALLATVVAARLALAGVMVYGAESSVEEIVHMSEHGRSGEWLPFTNTRATLAWLNLAASVIPLPGMAGGAVRELTAAARGLRGLEREVAQATRAVNVAGSTAKRLEAEERLRAAVLNLQHKAPGLRAQIQAEAAGLAQRLANYTGAVAGVSAFGGNAYQTITHLSTMSDEQQRSAMVTLLINAVSMFPAHKFMPTPQRLLNKRYARWGIDGETLEYNGNIALQGPQARGRHAAQADPLSPYRAVASTTHSSGPRPEDITIFSADDPRFVRVDLAQGSGGGGKPPRTGGRHAAPGEPQEPPGGQPYQPRHAKPYEPKHAKPYEGRHRQPEVAATVVDPPGPRPAVPQSSVAASSDPAAGTASVQSTAIATRPGIARRTLSVFRRGSGRHRAPDNERATRPQGRHRKPTRRTSTQPPEPTHTEVRPSFAGPEGYEQFLHTVRQGTVVNEPEAQAQLTYLTKAPAPDGRDNLDTPVWIRTAAAMQVGSPHGIIGPNDNRGLSFVSVNEVPASLADGLPLMRGRRRFGMPHGSFEGARTAAAGHAGRSPEGIGVVFRLVGRNNLLEEAIANGHVPAGLIDGAVVVNADGSTHPLTWANRDALHAPSPGERNAQAVAPAGRWKTIKVYSTVVAGSLTTAAGTWFMVDSANGGHYRQTVLTIAALAIPAAAYRGHFWAFKNHVIKQTNNRIRHLQLLRLGGAFHTAGAKEPIPAHVLDELAPQITTHNGLRLRGIPVDRADPLIARYKDAIATLKADPTNEQALKTLRSSEAGIVIAPPTLHIYQKKLTGLAGRRRGVTPQEQQIYLRAIRRLNRDQAELDALAFAAQRESDAGLRAQKWDAYEARLDQLRTNGSREHARTVLRMATAHMMSEPYHRHGGSLAERGMARLASWTGHRGMSGRIAERRDAFHHAMDRLRQNVDDREAWDLLAQLQVELIGSTQTGGWRGSRGWLRGVRRNQRMEMAHAVAGLRANPHDPAYMNVVDGAAGKLLDPSSPVGRLQRLARWMSFGISLTNASTLAADAKYAPENHHFYNLEPDVKGVGNVASDAGKLAGAAIANSINNAQTEAGPLAQSRGGDIAVHPSHRTPQYRPIGHVSRGEHVAGQGTGTQGGMIQSSYRGLVNTGRWTARYVLSLGLPRTLDSPATVLDPATGQPKIDAQTGALVRPPKPTLARRFPMFGDGFDALGAFSNMVASSVLAGSGVYAWMHGVPGSIHATVVIPVATMLGAAAAFRGFRKDYGDTQRSLRGMGKIFRGANLPSRDAMSRESPHLQPWDDIAADGTWRVGKYKIFRMRIRMPWGSLSGSTLVVGSTDLVLYVKNFKEVNHFVANLPHAVVDAAIRVGQGVIDHLPLIGHLSTTGELIAGTTTAVTGAAAWGLRRIQARRAQSNRPAIGRHRRDDDGPPQVTSHTKSVGGKTTVSVIHGPDMGSAPDPAQSTPLGRRGQGRPPPPTDASGWTLPWERLSIDTVRQTIESTHAAGGRLDGMLYVVFPELVNAKGRPFLRPEIVGLPAPEQGHSHADRAARYRQPATRDDILQRLPPSAYRSLDEALAATQHTLFEAPDGSHEGSMGDGIVIVSEALVREQGRITRDAVLARLRLSGSGDSAQVTGMQMNPQYRGHVRVAWPEGYEPGLPLIRHEGTQVIDTLNPLPGREGLQVNLFRRRKPDLALFTDEGVPRDKAGNPFSEEFPIPEGMYAITMHGYEGGRWVQYSDGRALNGREMADIIRADVDEHGQPVFKGQPIFLVVCDAAMGRVQFAQELANALGVDVYASTVMMQTYGSFPSRGAPSYDSIRLIAPEMKHLPPVRFERFRPGLDIVEIRENGKLVFAPDVGLGRRPGTPIDPGLPGMEPLPRIAVNQGRNAALAALSGTPDLRWHQRLLDVPANDESAEGAGMPSRALDGFVQLRGEPFGFSSAASAGGAPDPQGLWWKTLNAQEQSFMVQTGSNTCGPACGAQLAHRLGFEGVTQESLIGSLGTDNTAADALALSLTESTGRRFIGGCIPEDPKDLSDQELTEYVDKLTHGGTRPFMALFERPSNLGDGHWVLVNGFNEAGHLSILDPAGLTYEQTLADFRNAWHYGNIVY